MSFLSGILHYANDGGGGGGGWLGAIGAGPSGWGSSFGGWGTLGGEIGFEVALTGYFGMAGASIEDRLQNFVDIGAGTIIVNAKPGANGSTDTLLLNSLDQTFVLIHDGVGQDWTFSVFPADPNTPPPPAPGTDNAGFDGHQTPWHHYGDHFDLA